MKRLLPLVTLLCSVAAADPLVRIELLPSAKLAGDTVLLGEVAYLHAGDLDLMRKLVHLPLGRAPQAGQLGVLRRDGLASWLQRHAGLAPEAIAWSGAQESRVEREASRVAGDALAEAAIAAVQQALAAAGAAAQVRVRATPRDLELAAGELRLQARALAPGQLRRRVVVWVDVWAGQSVLRSVPVSVEIAREASALLLDGASDFIAPGRDVAVARGEWALLRAAAGAVALETRVEVLQDGRAGDKVRVRQSGATGAMLARVTGRGQLELAP